MQKKNPIAKKQAILEAAINAYHTNGYARTTIDDIARLAGVSKGAIYWHFKGKEAIFLALMSSWVETLYDLFQKLRDEDRSTEEKLRVLLEQSLLNPDKNILHLSTEFWYNHQSNSETIHTVQEIYGRYQEMFRVLLFDGMVKHEFRAINIEEVTASFMGMLEGVYNHQILVKKDPVMSSKAFVTGIEIFLAGIRNTSKDDREEEAIC